MNGYDLSRNFWNWAFENPELMSPNLAAIYFFAIEHCNRLGGKEKFGFPSQMTMDAVGISKHQTYSKYLNQLVDYGFIKVIQKSKNQYSANIISITSAVPKKDKALDKAFIKHRAKQTESPGKSIGQSTHGTDGNIVKQYNKGTNKQVTYCVSDFLKDWNEIRSEVTGNPSFVNRLQPVEKDQFNEISEAYTREHFRNAIKGLFKQDKFPKGVTAMNSSPKHFLNYFELYLTAHGDKNKNVWGND